MRSPLQAMLWELWRTSRFELLFRIGWSAALVVLLSGVVAVVIDDEFQMAVIRGVFIMLLTTVSVASQTWIRTVDRQNSGFTFQLGFVRPISTAMLVGVPLAYSMVTSVICFVLPAMLLNVLQSMAIPLVGPSVVIAATVACMMAAAWSPITTIGKLVTMTATAVGLITTLLVYQQSHGQSEPMLMAIGREEYFAMGWQPMAALLGVATVAFAITVLAVDRQRHGDAEQLVVLARLPRWRGQPVRARRPFSGKLAAQCWYEWRRCGPRVLLLSLGLAALTLTFVCLGPLIKPGWQGAPYVWLITLMLCPFVYQIVGADCALGLKARQGVTFYPAFDAACPLPNDVLIGNKLVVIAGCSLAGVLVMGLTAAGHQAVAGDWHIWSQLGSTLSRGFGELSIYWLIGGMAYAALLMVSSTAMLLAFGMWIPKHTGLFTALTIFVVSHLFLVAWDANHGWVLLWLWQAYGYLFGIAALIGSVVALRRAIVSGSLGRRFFVASCCLWGGYVVFTLVLSTQVTQAISLPPAVLFLGATWLLVPLASAAMAPLALASHRHD